MSLLSKNAERILQRKCESYLLKHRIPYLRLPDAIYRSIKKMSAANAKEVAERITGWPDISIYKVAPDGSLLSLCIELKSPKGKMSTEQKKWQQHLATKVCRDYDTFKQMVDEFWS